MGWLWALSQEDAQSTRESGTEEMGEVNLTPSETESPTAPSSPSAGASKEVPVAKPGIPVKLLIPSIGVKAPVEQGELLSSRQQLVPESMHTTSWFSDGSQPGEPGNAVIVGHTWSKGDGVFDRLPQLAAGDTIIVRTEEGEIKFSVTSVGQIPIDEFEKNAEAIYRVTGPPGLILMTCGDWNGSGYDATTVVYAELS